ncbi:uncharacterized protein TNCT_357531 [Trichonephila clavata]|uniref:Uncharacterized protein n=1 Tax=Trichonephila clavata TaxID=2740835 RepID=A0A8X6J0V3_TRICU|nr:uncharacterized protein TNCT_357531 [Trichonephila clavata]
MATVADFIQQGRKIANRGFVSSKLPLKIQLDKSRRTEHEMDQFRPQQHGTRLRPGPRESEDRSYSGQVTVEARTTRPEDANVYESFDERRRSYDEPYHRSRGKIIVGIPTFLEVYFCTISQAENV